MKVLIADDEIIIREGISSVISWEELGFILLKPVSSAEEVIRQLDRECPDILITDIRMKGMSGLDLVSYITEKKYQIESILLTGYDDFEYIQEAIRQNVCDYLLKTSSPDDIIAAVERAKKRLQRIKEYDQLKEHEAERAVVNQLKEALQNEMKAFPKQTLVDLIPAFKEAPYQLLLIDETSTLHDIQVHEELWNSYLNGKWFTYHNHTLILLKRDKYLKDDYLLQVASRRIKDLYGKPVIMSSIVSSLDEIAHLYKQVVSFIPYQWILRDYTVLTEKDIVYRKGISYTDHMTIYKNELNECMKNGDKEKLRAWISNFIDWLLSHPDATPRSIQFYVQHLYIDSIRLVNQYGQDEKAMHYDSMPVFQEWFQNPKEELFSLLSVISQNFKLCYQKNTNYVEESLNYMKNHLGDPLSLKEIAEKIPVHPNYLSVVIRRKTGKSYVELLTDLRIKKAADYFMYTSMSVKEVTKLVGYNDSKYFTKIFKKYYKMTPTQYRETYYQNK
ncbi:DNA-binding response regulator [Halolactibacillus alkaliphilus]|uniref:DNA-binding response regulator n=1 Tax=Halolactibacillus alkaliphilus TaxID=442899 RepID=A0A511X0A9_9BACI|nr:response regulator [Halolactibacillus alkaliphilus]GEN56383.1 DNA-binding response regulator [Halolactibacillus alkaliphilus]GGN67413.1 DNA-binding response regulator [Halolactibacillus alkaliphilus]SFO92221.1 two-component system, response regulator YesN [Halolactibacillus alkaliphilus]